VFPPGGSIDTSRDVITEVNRDVARVLAQPDITAR
jgi:hypothetical protein